MDYKQVFESLKLDFPSSKVFIDQPLGQYTTLKIGGPADIFINTQNTEEFVNILKYIYDLRSTIELTILGNGSNVLISDSGIRGIVIKNDSQEIENIGDNKIKISSGTQLISALNFLADNNLSGLEEFAYIPSTIGGAIVGNIHGFDKNNFSSILESIEVFDLNKSTISTLQSKDLAWSYDQSIFQANPNLIIVSAVLVLKSGEKETIKKTAQEIIEIKLNSQLMNSAGCAFKNLPEAKCMLIWGEKKSTGQIIDQDLNLKSYCVGNAQVSPLHANFIINNGNATAKDYLGLVNLIQSQMQTKYGFQFELEIKLLGQF
ncbi:MAG: UDP-N-acetylmuramate dehydrogenase [Candidatus Shapirobacteria bacterium]